MAAIPEREDTTAHAVVQWHANKQDTGGRPHLGASLIGHPCERNLWLTFRWAKAQQWDGRMLRLFQIGQRAEFRFIEELRGAGLNVSDADQKGNQWRVSSTACGHHFGGSMDGAVQGLPEAPKAWHVVEFKTHNDKSFKDLLGKGVQMAKPQHWAQMQVYMGLTGMERALYYAENKNDAAVYTERVHFDKAAFDGFEARALRVITNPEPPQRISNDASWFECKWCNHHSLCHGTDAPQANCRTCAHSTPELDGNARWSCAAHGVDIDGEQQRKGCNAHRVIPILLERIGTVVQASDNAVTYRMADGREFTNGDPDANPAHVSSAEIHACKNKETLLMTNDAFVRDMRAQFGGRLVA